MLGIVFSLAAAATFALNAAAARRAVLTGSVLQGLIITVPMGVPLFLAVMLAAGEGGLLASFPLAAYLWFAAAGIVHFVIGRYANYSAAGAIGMNLASPIMQSEVIVTLVLAMFVLGESLTPLRALGIALVLIGPGMVGRSAQNSTKAPAAAGAAPNAAASTAAAPLFTPRYAEGYGWAVAASVAYGLSPIFITLGLRAAGGTGVIAGGLVSYVAASLAVAVMVMVLRPPASIYRLDRKTLGWFVFAGVFVFLSHAFRYAALAFAPASVVTALQRLSSLFRIYFAWMINRDYEVFDRSVIVATVVAMLGAMALSVSTEMFLSLADWPDWVVWIAGLKWP